MLRRLITVAVMTFLSSTIAAKTVIDIDSDRAELLLNEQDTYISSGNATAIIQSDTDRLIIKGEKIIAVNLKTKGKQKTIEVLAGTELANFCQSSVNSNEKICGWASQLKYYTQSKDLYLVKNALVKRFEGDILKGSVQGERIVYNGATKTYSINKTGSQQQQQPKVTADKDRVRITINVD